MQRPLGTLPDGEVDLYVSGNQSSGLTAQESRSGPFARGNSVLNNGIRGRARAALALIDQNAGMPGNSLLVANDVDCFQSSLADIFVDAGVANTVVIGHQARVGDDGSGTVVVPMP